MRLAIMYVLELGWRFEYRFRRKRNLTIMAIFLLCTRISRKLQNWILFVFYFVSSSCLSLPREPDLDCFLAFPLYLAVITCLQMGINSIDFRSVDIISHQLWVCLSPLHPMCKCMHPMRKSAHRHSCTWSKTSWISQLVPQPISSQALTPESIPSIDSPVIPNSAMSTGGPER